MVKNKVIIHLAINVNRDYIGLTITALIYRIKVGRVGQLLVVAHHTDNSPSLCYEPELIPDLVLTELGKSIITLSASTLWRIKTL